MTATPPDGARATKDPIHRGRLLKGAGTFGVLTVAGLGILFASTVSGETLVALRGVSVGFILLALGAMVADLLIGAARYQIFLTKIRPGSPFGLPIRADLANRFTGAVTPSQTGGGPAQVFILFRGGIPVPDALSFLAINFLSTLVFFLIAGGFTAYGFRAELPQGAVALLVRYGFVAFAAMGVFVFLALLRPDLIARPCAGLAARLRRREGWRRGVRKACDAVVASLERYRDACTRFVRESPRLLLYSFALTVVLYLNKFTLGYFVLRGLGVEADYVEVLAVQALLQFILYVAPSPGASGIAELTTAALMARFMEAHLLGVYTIAFRFFLLYLPAAVGSFVLISALRPKGDRCRRLPWPWSRHHAYPEAEGGTLP